ncbi:MAG: diacylglycerol kinase family lipid kinase [Lachnospiraceae bacterium]|nr:diacylglycerol kinase family lipid kinase [Lachnospiraceae bacterium]
MKKMLFIYNPKSGKGMIRTHLAEIIDIFTKAEYFVTVHPTQCSGDAGTFARDYGKNYDIVVASGGDGTLDEVVNGMMEADSDVPIGYIPAGSTNDFGSSLSIPKDMLEAAKRIVKGTLFPCDIGGFNDKNFVYVAAFGMFTEVSYETDQNLKNTLGHMAYIVEAAKKVWNIPSLHMKVESADFSVEGNFTYGMVSNAKSVGGIKGLTGGNVELDDGLLEVTLVSTPKNPVELSEIVSALFLGGAESHLVKRFQTERVLFTCENPVAWTLDGERGGEYVSADIFNKRRRLNFISFN